MTTHDRDALIRQALTPAETVHAPSDLGDQIYHAILATPQRRPRFGFAGMTWLPAPVPAVALLLLLALLLVLGLVLAIASRPPGLPPELNTYHGGAARTGVMAGPGPAGSPVVAWEASRRGAMSFQIMPLVAGGRVFVADDSGTIAGLDEQTGAERWSTSVGSPIHSSPVLDNGLVIFGSDDGTVTAVRATDGSVAWRFTAGGPVSASPLVADATLFVGSEDGVLHALDPSTGLERWSIPVGGPVTRGAAVADGLIYVGAKAGRFSAIDATTHEVRWTRELGPGEIGTPAVAGGIVYVPRGLLAAAPPHDLLALGVRDGSALWAFGSPSGEQVYIAAVGGGFAYAVSLDHNVYGLDAATGTLRWAFMTGGQIGSLAALVDGVLYVTGDDRMVRALDAATGAQRWSIKVEGTPTMPAVIDGRVIVGTNLGKVVAIAGTGEGH